MNSNGSSISRAAKVLAALLTGYVLSFFKGREPNPQDMEGVWRYRPEKKRR